MLRRLIVFIGAFTRPSDVATRAKSYDRSGRRHGLMLTCDIRSFVFLEAAPGRNIGCYDSAMSDMTSRPDSALESPASRSSEILRDTPPEEAEGGEGGIVGCGLLHNRKRYFGLVLLMLIYYGALLAMSWRIRSECSRV